MKRVMVVVVSSVLLFISCSKDSGTSNNNPTNPTTPNCTGVTVSYINEVSPIIQSTCATNSSCHGTGSTNGPGELTSYSKIRDTKDQIQSAVINGRMPKTGSLSTAQKNAIYCWVSNGAPNN